MNAETIPLLQHPTEHRAVGLIGWLAFCLAAAGTAFFVSTSGWYADLQKPPWNPPGWVFAPAWTSLYVMMAVAAWLVWREGGWSVQRRPLGLFLGQWLLNVRWTPLFFKMHEIGAAFGESLALLLLLAATVILFGRVNMAAALFLLPYLSWVSFAVFLNFTIWRLNA